MTREELGGWIVRLAPFLPVLVAAWWVEKKYNAWGDGRKAARRARFDEILEQAEQEGIGLPAAILRHVRNEARIAWRDARAAFEKRIGKRLFKDVLGSWPVVRQTAPGVLVMKAPYLGPRRVQDCGGWKPPVLTGVAVGVLYWLAFQRVAPSPEDAAGAAAGAAFYCALISIPFWRLARKTRFVIRFDQGEISWKEPPASPVPGFGIKHRVGPEEPRGMQAIPHRSGPEEARKHAEWMRSNPNRRGPEPLFQTASELILHTGPGGSHWRTVAEFCNDETRQQAHRLLEAIDYVTERAKEELDALAREA